MSCSASSAVNRLFHRMFSDSQIAAKFSCSETKCAYVCRFGLAPFSSDLLHHELKADDAFVLLLNESLNKTRNMKHKDVYVHLWNCRSRKWCTASLHDVMRSWKMILGGHGKVMENF